MAYCNPYIIGLYFVPYYIQLKKKTRALCSLLKNGPPKNRLLNWKVTMKVNSLGSCIGSSATEAAGLSTLMYHLD